VLLLFKLFPIISGINDKKLEQHPHAVNRYNVFYKKLDSEGGLFVKNESIWENKPGYENARVMIVFKGNEITAVYDEDGEQLYPDSEALERKKWNTVYVDAKIKKGKRVGGKAIGSYPDGIPRKVLNQYKDQNLVIDHVPFSSKGRPSVGRKALWGSRQGYENAQDNVIYIERGVEKAVYDKDGDLLYGEDVENPDIVARNSVYFHSTLRDGKFISGQFVG